MRKGAAAAVTLTATGIPTPDTSATIRRENALMGAMADLGLPPLDDQAGARDRLAMMRDHFRAYRDEMARALALEPVNREEAVPRDAIIFAARRGLAVKMIRSVGLMAPMVAEIDASLGLPPVDPTLGLPT